jgi:undecaprenyl-diphosphatase
VIELLYGLPLLVKAMLLGIVEGLTEFLPISSTGHLILASSLLGFSGDKENMFNVAIQTGAMFAVIWYYRVRILETFAGLLTEPRAQRFALNVLIAFMPAAVLGLTFGGFVKDWLFRPVPVAIALIIGGVVILWVESRHRRGLAAARVHDIDSMTIADAVRLGIAQSFALIPGTSRSGATIIGGMLFGLSRKTATEFSFFLAIPTLIGAGVYDAWKYRDLLTVDDIPLFSVGLAFSFVSALACVHWLIRWVATHDFRVFAWYRIAFGGLVLLTAATGTVNWVQ